MPALFRRMSKRDEERVNVLAACFTDENEERSRGTKVIFALGLPVVIASIVLSAFALVRAARNTWAP